MSVLRKIKQDLLVWSIVVGVFAVLTLIAVHFDSIRTSPVFNNADTTGRSSAKALHLELHQPGNSVVLAQ